MKISIFFLIPLFFMGACSSPKYLSTPGEFMYQVKGLTFEVQLDGGLKLLGEIIEIDSEAITILPIYQTIRELKTISKNQIESADIIISTTSDNPGNIGVWAGLINLGSIGQGWWGFLTLPINLAITLSIAGNAKKGTYRIRYPDNISWDEMSKFARFPQGIPQNIDPNEIE